MPTPGAAAGSDGAATGSDGAATGSEVPVLFRDLFDDAALFPPASESMTDALRGHLAHSEAWYARTVGVFVCSSTRLAELSAALESAGQQVELALTVPGGAADVQQAVVAALADRRIFLRGVEVPGGNSVDETVKALEAVLPAEVEGYVEVPWRIGVDAAIRRLARAGLRAKFRTGGQTMGSVPSADSLGHAIKSCATAAVPFKLTAGLHAAVAGRDAFSGAEHHGFLNVMLAAYAAQHDADGDSCARLLRERDVAAGFRGLPPDQAIEVRELFRSFGTCSISEPVDDLVRLGLLEQP